MKTINTVNAAVIAKAAAEAGIREDEKYIVRIISCEGTLAEMVIETEWSRIDCYADIETGEILGLMTQPKSIIELLNESRTCVSAVNRRKAA